MVDKALDGVKPHLMVTDSPYGVEYDAAWRGSRARRGECGMSGTDLVIAKLDSARIALIEAKTIQAAKKVADIAKAMKVYSAQQKLGKEVEAHAHAIFIEAMRRVGEILRDTDRQGPGQYQQISNGSELVPLAIPPTLDDLGLTKKESERLIAIHNDEQVEIESVLAQMIPKSFLDACCLLEFVTIMADQGGCMADGELAMLKNVVAGLRVAWRDEIKAARNDGMEEMRRTLNFVTENANSLLNGELAIRRSLDIRRPA